MRDGKKFILKTNLPLTVIPPFVFLNFNPHFWLENASIIGKKNTLGPLRDIFKAILIGEIGEHMPKSLQTRRKT